LSRLFISHSSKDSIEAIAFKQWLCANDWPAEEIFLDLDGIHAGEDWKDALRKAHTRARPRILAKKSSSCCGEQHTVRFNGEQLGKIKTYLVERGLSPDHFLWPPHDRPNTNPFPGLSAFTEDDAGIFFGRDADILRGLDRLRILRRNGEPRLLVIQAASGAGKSSYLRAGLWLRLTRDPDFAPLGILRPSQGILTGPEGLGRKLAALLSRPAQPVSPGEIHPQLMAQDTAKAAETFGKLLVTAAAQAHAQRQIGDREARAPALILAIDQAEELFGADDQAESERFLLLLGSFMRDLPAGVELFCLFAIRADSAARLFQAIADLNLEVPETLPLLPLPQTSYRDVILKPLDVLARRGQRLTLSRSSRPAWWRTRPAPMRCLCSPSPFPISIGSSAPAAA
jgi:hypothetical protein